MSQRIFIAFALLVLAPSLRAQDSSAQDERSLIKDLQQRVSKLESSPAKASPASFNPAMGMALDGVFRDSNDKAGFLFRAAEINLEAPVDPYLKAWGIINGSNGGVSLEEAALETTSLPWSLTARGGRLFASFGRLAHFHDHELPVIDRPSSLDTYVGGETQADGLEISWLAPTDLYLNATFGAYNKIGADNARADNTTARPLDEFTYMGRLSTYLDLGESHSVELGADSAWTPKRSAGRNMWRTLNGLDMTYRYQPPRGGIYKGLVWGAEVLQNHERRFDAATSLPRDRVRAYSGYSYVEVKSGRRLRGGVMADLTEDQDNPHRLTKTFTGFLSFDVTEFQRLRASFAEALVNVPGARKNHIFALQWTGIIGSHVHGFRDR